MLPDGSYVNPRSKPSSTAPQYQEEAQAETETPKSAELPKGGVPSTRMGLVTNGVSKMIIQDVPRSPPYPNKPPPRRPQDESNMTYAQKESFYRE